MTLGILKNDIRRWQLFGRSNLVGVSQCRVGIPREIQFRFMAQQLPSIPVFLVLGNVSMGYVRDSCRVLWQDWRSPGPWTCVLIVSQALGGLLVALVVK